MVKGLQINCLQVFISGSTSLLYRFIDIGIELEKQLEKNSFLAGDYSIADIAIFPWVAAYSKSLDKLAEFPHIERWLERIGDREAVKRGMSILRDK